MSTIRLQNKTRRPAKMVTVNLPHKFLCEVACLCQKSTMAISELNPRTGVKAFREMDRSISPSLTLQAGEISQDYPASIADAPEVRAAIDRGELVVLK